MTNLRLSAQDWGALSPLLILLGAALLVLVYEIFSSAAAKKYAGVLTAAALGAALYAALAAPASQNPLLTAWLRFDGIGQFFTVFFLGITLACAALSASFFRVFPATRGEYSFLLLSCVFGLVLIGMSADFLTLFLGLETLSLSLYVMCAYMKKWEVSHEAALKYFLLGALAAAFLLFGIALIYGAVGTTRFAGLLEAYRLIAAPESRLLFLSGSALVTLGFAFKAAVVPFHVWAPDVYEGAPTPVTAFMAVGTKAGAFAAFLLVFAETLPQWNPLWNDLLAFLAVPTLIYANWVALKQTQLRRFFAYSGISHAGYLLIPLVAGTPEALSAFKYYLVIYAAATLGAFAVLAFADKRGEGIFLNDLRGFFRRAPVLAGILAFSLLTLAGIPPTAGFFAKFYLFKTAYEAGCMWLVLLGLLVALFAAYYYLRIVAAMFMERPADETKPAPSWPAAAVALTCFAAIAAVSLFPSSLLALFSGK